MSIRKSASNSLTRIIKCMNDYSNEDCLINEDVIILDEISNKEIMGNHNYQDISNFPENNYIKQSQNTIIDPNVIDLTKIKGTRTRKAARYINYSSFVNSGTSTGTNTLEVFTATNDMIHEESVTEVIIYSHGENNVINSENTKLLLNNNFVFDEKLNKNNNTNNLIIIPKIQVFKDLNIKGKNNPTNRGLSLYTSMIVDSNRDSFNFRFKFFGDLYNIFEEKLITLGIQISVYDVLDNKFICYKEIKALKKYFFSDHNEDSINLKDYFTKKYNTNETPQYSLYDNLGNPISSHIVFRIRFISNTFCDNFTSIYDLFPNTNYNMLLERFADNNMNIRNALKSVKLFSGIFNHGNTCYFNCFFQLINHIPSLRKIFCSIPTLLDKQCYSKEYLKIYDNENYNAMFFKHFKVLLYLSFSSKSEVSYDTILPHIPNYEHLMQQDLNEITMSVFDIFSCYLDSLKNMHAYSSKDLKRDTEIEINYSYTNITTYKQVSSLKEKFLFLSINIEKTNNLNSAVNEHFNEEVIENEDVSKMVSKKGFITSLPNILFIQLNRFSFKNNAPFKNNKYFEYYDNLDLSNYCSSNILNEDESNYSLFSVVIHDGKFDGGHYFMYVKQRKYIKELDKYLYYFVKINDDKVNICLNLSHIFDLNFGGQLSSFNVKDNITNSSTFNPNLTVTDNTRNAYILVYYKNKYINEIFSNCDSNNKNSEIDNICEVKLKEYLNHNNDFKFLETLDLRDTENLRRKQEAELKSNHKKEKHSKNAVINLISDDQENLSNKTKKNSLSNNQELALIEEIEDSERNDCLEINNKERLFNDKTVNDFKFLTNNSITKKESISILNTIAKENCDNTAIITTYFKDNLDNLNKVTDFNILPLIEKGGSKFSLKLSSSMPFYINKSALKQSKDKETLYIDNCCSLLSSKKIENESNIVLIIISKMSKIPVKIITKQSKLDLKYFFSQYKSIRDFEFLFYSMSNFSLFSQKIYNNRKESNFHLVRQEKLLRVMDKKFNLVNVILVCKENSSMKTNSINFLNKDIDSMGNKEFLKLLEKKSEIKNRKTFPFLINLGDSPYSSIPANNFNDKSEFYNLTDIEMKYNEFVFKNLDNNIENFKNINDYTDKHLDNNCFNKFINKFENFNDFLTKLITSLHNEGLTFNRNSSCFVEDKIENIIKKDISMIKKVELNEANYLSQIKRNIESTYSLLEIEKEECYEECLEIGTYHFPYTPTIIMYEN